MPDCVTQPLEPTEPTTPERSHAVVLDIRRAPHRVRDSVVITHSDANDHILNIIRRTSWFYEADLLSALEQRLRPGDLIIDIGANIGNHTLFFAAACGCRVIAIEPNPIAFALLEENVRLNGLQDRVNVLNLALGAVPGRGRIKHIAAHNLGSAEVVEESEGPIQIETLDTIWRDGGVRLLKLDAEGFEAAIIRGGIACLSTTRATVAVEARDESYFLEVAALLEPLGYVCLETRAATATHIFDSVEGADSRPILAALGRAAALNAIAIRALNARLSREIRHLRRQITSSRP